MDTTFLTDSQHRLCFPAGFSVPDKWIASQSRSSDPTDAPFRRKVEFWLLSIAYAIRRGIPPNMNARLEQFATVGPHERNDVKLDSQVLQLLLHVAIWHRREDITRETVPSAADVFKICNAYAAAAVSALLDEFEGEGGTALDPTAVKLAKLAGKLVSNPASRL